MTSTESPSSTVLPTSVSVPPPPASVSAGRSAIGLAMDRRPSEAMVSERPTWPQPLTLFGAAKQDWIVAFGPM